MSTLSVELIRNTPAPEQLAALGAKLCYSGAHLDQLRQRIEESEQDIFLSGVIETGHLSVLEHITFTFALEGVSRILLAQITRHRIASFSVQSQRYVSQSKVFDYVIPPSIVDLGEEAVQAYVAQMQTMHAWYMDWQKRLGEKGEASNEDARFVLPGACATRMIVTMNARELLHFFSLRCCRRAQWEIRAVAEEMLRCVYQVAPAVFETAGPQCIVGSCPEGKRSCLEHAAVRRHMMELKRPISQ